MVIKRDERTERGVSAAFIALDDMGKRLGRATVSARMNIAQMPERPFEVTIAVTGYNEAWPQLVAASTVSAMTLIRAQEPPVPARIISACGVKNRVYMQLLKSIGFVDDDALERMKRPADKGSSVSPPPQGTLLIRDTLDDERERAFVLERLERIHMIDDNEAWLRERENQPLFQRFLLTSESGLCGEALCRAEAHEGGLRGVIDLVYTSPAWRRRGAALCLMEAARQYFAEAGCRDIVLDVRRRNAAAHSLSYAAGYRPEEVLSLLPGIDL